MQSGTRIGTRYDLVRPLGAGGMGEVYLARDTTLQRDVAIKFLPQELSGDASARERLRREALAAASLDHPFICKVFEIGEADEQLFVVMEYVEGETLHEALGRGPLASTTLVALALELVDALDVAHHRRIVHRDLKPGNIMLTSQRHAKVMDFGLAKLLPDASGETLLASNLPITRKGTRVGTPAYMSPEQIAGDAVDHRSDIFALGVVLAEALTGIHPFIRDTAAGTMTAVLNEPPLVQIGSSIGQADPSLRAVLLRMLAKPPEARYQSAAEIRLDLQSLRPGPGTDDQTRTPRPVDTPVAVRARRWPMVGRDQERADLERRVEDALAGRGGVVLIGGEPGIGKTRLTEEILTHAQLRGASAVVGHCYEMQGSPPYVPFVEIVEHTCRVVPPAALRRLLGDDAPEVSRLVPDLRRMFDDIPPPMELPPEQQRWHFFKAFRAYVGRACQIAPIVAVFEDLHWADEPTLQLLLHLAQTTASMSLLMIGTYRDVELEVTRPFAKVLESLLRQRLATRMALHRLSSSGVDVLLQAMSGGDTPAPTAFAEVVFRETEGNPFFVEEVFQHLAEEGRLFTQDGRWRPDLRVETLDVPEGVRLVIGRRLERLGDAARRVLTNAAIIGRVFSLRLLEELESAPGGMGADALLDAIEEAERAQLVTTHTGGRDAQYTFSHELIRQTLADALSFPRRQRLHARIGAAIETVYATSLTKHTSALAHHLYQAGAAADPEKTTAYLVQAADQAREASGHEEALSHLDNAISLWEGEATERMADLLDRRGRVLASLARTEEAVETYRSAAALWHQQERYDRYATTMKAASSVLVWDMEIPTALAEVERAVRVLEAAPAALRAPLLYTHAYLLSVKGAVAEGAERLAEADRARAGLTDPFLDALALDISAKVCWGTWRWNEAATFQQQATDAWGALGRPWEAVDSAFILPWTRRPTRKTAEESMALVAELESRADRVGHRGAQWALRDFRVAAASLSGQLIEGERLARSNLEFAQAHRVPWAFFTEMRLGLCLLHQGRMEEALAHLRHAADIEPESYYGYVTRSNLFTALSYCAPGEAREYFASTDIPLPVEGRVNSTGSWLNVYNVVEGLHVLGDHEKLARMRTLSETLARSPLAWVTMGATPAACAGVTCAAAGAWEESEEYLRSTLASTDATTVVPGRCTALEWYGDVLLMRGGVAAASRAAPLYAEAQASYANWGATFLAERLTGKIARLHV